MADRYTKIRAKQFKNFDLRPEDVKAVNTPDDKYVLAFLDTDNFIWLPIGWYVYEKKEGSSSTTSSSYQTKLTLSAVIPQTGAYLLVYSFESRATSYFSSARCQVRVRQTLPTTATLNRHEETSPYFNLSSGFKVLNFNEGDNVEFLLQYRSIGGFSTARIRRARMLLKYLGE